ncbi:extracellular solute-binding protein [Roseovarius sp. M141]|uniref:extracellular solute-binding protein n=1 Tax=Roseovarius sp. M141 TaxID=2583806 RepID=UPI0020CF32EF|nr:extracellular solute-binding protein [Roseovarius sp. M141]MCQ0091949.1 extracellular solute-binding protein [Roseovarius sp. M141]
MRFSWKTVLSRRRMSFAGLMLAALPIAVSAQSTTETGTAINKNEITFTSWTGPYMRSQMLGFVRPYESEANTRVNVARYNGGIDEIRDQVESANVIWDVVDLTQADSLRACKEGLLEDLSDINLPDGKDGSAASDDFVEGALNECGVGVIVWATAFAYSNPDFQENPPTSIADFFDVDTYPGARAIRDDPTVIMEWALMADGVPREDVYPTLETPEGVERAFKKMETIRAGLQLWQAGREPVRMLNAGEVAMSMIWATTGMTASMEEGADFTVIMDGRVVEVDLFGIPKGSRFKEEAMDFIRYASSTEALAEMVSYLPNGPTRKSSLALLSDESLNQIPNGPAYEDKIHILSDAGWWAENHSRLEEKFDIWMSAGARQGPAGTVR